MQAAATVAAKVVTSVSKTGKVLGKALKVGSPPFKIAAARMALDVRKLKSSSLVKKKIQSAIGGLKIDGGLDVEGDDCITTQV